MRGMANGAAFAQRFVLEGEGAGLFAMTLGAGFIEPRHRQPAAAFENIASVRVVALHTVHLLFQNRMMLRQTEFRVGLQMALKASGRILAGIDDEFAAAPASFDVFAARAMAGFTTGLSGHCGVREVNPGMWAGVELADVICVALETRVVADEMRAGNFWWRKSRARQRGTGV